MSPRRRAVTIAGVVVGVVLALGAWDALRVRSSLLAVRTQLEPATRAARSYDVRALRAITDAAAVPAARAERVASSLWLRMIGKVPVAGRSVVTMRALAGASREAVAGASHLIDALAAFPTEGGKLDYRVRDGVVDLAPWARAAAAIERAAVRLRTSPGGLLLPPVGSARAEASRRLDRLAEAARSAADTARLLPSMLGEQRPRRYIAVLQNLAEQRATGGIPTGTVSIEARDGRLTLGSVTSNIFLTEAERDVPQPSWFARRYDRFKTRRLWVNSNAEADLRVTGPLMASLYRELTGERVDGVVLIDPLALRELLRVTGPIPDPLGRPVNADRIAPLIETEQYRLFPGSDQRQRLARKGFFEQLARTIWEAFIASSDVDAATDALARAAADRHVQIWSSDARERAALERAGVGGVVGRTRDATAIAVITQSGSGNKMDTYLRRRLRIKVRAGDDGLWHVTMRIGLRNAGRSSGLPPYVLGTDTTVPSYSPGYIRSYLSVYLPPDAFVGGYRLGPDEAAYESERVPHALIISSFVVLRPGQDKTVVLEALLRPGPGGLSAPLDLVLQKQPTPVPDRVSVTAGARHLLVAEREVDGDLRLRVPPGRGLMRRVVDLLALTRVVTARGA